jgi:hypothetical protein
MVNDLLTYVRPGLLAPAITREPSWEEPMGSPEFGVMTVCLLIVGVVLCYWALALGGYFLNLPEVNSEALDFHGLNTFGS